MDDKKTAMACKRSTNGETISDVNEFWCHSQKGPGPNYGIRPEAKISVSSHKCDRKSWELRKLLKYKAIHCFWDIIQPSVAIHSRRETSQLM